MISQEAIDAVRQVELERERDEASHKWDLRSDFPAIGDSVFVNDAEYVVCGTNESIQDAGVEFTISARRIR